MMFGFMESLHWYGKGVSYLKDIVDEECDLSVRAGVLMERLKAYEPELPKDMEPMVVVLMLQEYTHRLQNLFSKNE